MFYFLYVFVVVFQNFSNQSSVIVRFVLRCIDFDVEVRKFVVDCIYVSFKIVLRVEGEFFLRYVIYIMLQIINKYRLIEIDQVELVLLKLEVFGKKFW